MTDSATHHHPSPNHDSRGETPVSMIILHYTGMQSATASRLRLCDPDAKVSAHYQIDEDGSLWPLVPEHRRAWHAGASYWRGLTALNAHSIGIELVNPGHEFGYRPFPEAQINVLLTLLDGIRRRHNIPDSHIVGHSDIAPMRKQDPGELFPWQQLHRAGHGIWPNAPISPTLNSPSPAVPILPLLHRLGYDPSAEPQLVVRAFQRHFQPYQLSGIDDAETRAICMNLLAQWPETV